MLEPPQQGSPIEASWQWRVLPAMHFGSHDGKGCVLSDGRFAVLGGWDINMETARSCEVLTLDGGGERWNRLEGCNETRRHFEAYGLSALHSRLGKGYVSHESM